MSRVRVRVAPSPTGDPHVGFAFTALFNFLYARSHAGKFIFRLEDTDRTRLRQDSEARLLESLRWLGLECDESPSQGGPHAPYRQSERLPLYQHSIETLLQSGHAYRCFCSAARLENLRNAQRQQKHTPRYDRRCRALSPDVVARQTREGMPSVVRLKVPAEDSTEFHDELRGEIRVANSQLDDAVLLKSDGYPVYHLASVVDDHAMQISHVIRAEEWLSSTPKHILLYQALGFTPPRFLHLPILRNRDHSKISKRKNPVALRLFAQLGILPAALVNYLALIGGSIEHDHEMFDRDTMVKSFAPQRLNLGGPVFDVQKLLWLNQQYIQNMSEDAFVQHLREEMFDETKLRRIYPLLRTRLENFAQFFSQSAFFFDGIQDYQSQLEALQPPANLPQVLAALCERLENLTVWTQADIKAQLQAVQQESGLKTKELYLPLRLLVTGRKNSPELLPVLELLGRELVTYRLRSFLHADFLI